MVRLWAEEHTLNIQVKDQGKGLNLQSVLVEGMTSGLPGINERAALCGGNVDIEAQPGKGTCITAELPLIKA